MKKWIALTLAACAAMLAARALGYGNIATVAKLTASTAFILTALAAGAVHFRYGRTILAGLFFAWWGDAFLTRSGDLYFQLGLVSFLTAHVLYCVAFYIHGIDRRVALLAAGPILIFAAAVLFWLYPDIPTNLRIPVFAYIVVISSMVALSFGTRGAGGPVSIVAGGVLFYLSDISVAIGQFKNYAFPHYLWGLPFYFIAQLFLAASIVHVTQNTTLRSRCLANVSQAPRYNLS